jgi:hypothetical protein
MQRVCPKGPREFRSLRHVYDVAESEISWSPKVPSSRMRGFTITREYCDPEHCGAKGPRPALDEMLQDAKRDKFRLLLVWRLDRLWRSVAHLVRLLDDFGAWTIHDRLKRCETAGLRDGTWMGDELAAHAGLDIQSAGFAKDVWHAAQQSYSLEPAMGVVKFGPHHVVVKTPLSNIRITTFFAGEWAAKIVDPSRISEVQAVGCEVDFAPPIE